MPAFVAFVVLLFPWDALGRRIVWEINRVSAARVEVESLSPAISARGPVLRASDVRIHHPAVDQLRISSLEIAPRFSTSWLGGDPTIRVWAETGLGTADGVLRLGETPPTSGACSTWTCRDFRSDSTNNLRLGGRLDADADVALDPAELSGRVEFARFLLQTAMLPVQIPFSRATGVVEILDSGATRIADVVLTETSSPVRFGEIGLVHRSRLPRPGRGPAGPRRN